MRHPIVHNLLGGTLARNRGTPEQSAAQIADRLVPKPQQKYAAAETEHRRYQCGPPSRQAHAPSVNGQANRHQDEPDARADNTDPHPAAWSQNLQPHLPHRSAPMAT